MLLRVMHFLQHVLDLPGEIPDQAQFIGSTFAGWQYLTAHHGRFVSLQQGRFAFPRLENHGMDSPWLIE